MGEAKKLMKNTMIYTLGDIIPRGISLFVFPVLTTYLLPEDYGIINYVNTLNVLLLIVGFLCLNTYYLVHYYRYQECDRPKLLCNLSVFIVGFNIVLTAALSLLGIVFPNALSSNIPFFPYIFIGLITNFFNIFSILPIAMWRMQENPAPVAAVSISRGIISAGITLLFVIVFHYKALGVLIANLAVNIGFFVIFVYVTIKHSKWCIDFSEIKKALKFSIPLLPGAMAYYLMNMSDRFFIDRFLSLKELGIYSTASTLALIMNIVSQGGYKSLEPYFFKIYNQTDFEPKFFKVQKIFAAALLVTGAGLSIFAQDFFKVFANEKYGEVYIYVPLILIGVIFSSFSLLYTTIVTAKGRTKVQSLISMTGGGISVIINLILLPIIGLYGACASSAITFFVVLCLSVKTSGMIKHFRHVIVAFIFTYLIIIGSVYLIDIPNLINSILVRIAIFILVILVNYRILLWKTGINFSK